MAKKIVQLVVPRGSYKRFRFKLRKKHPTTPSIPGDPIDLSDVSGITLTVKSKVQSDAILFQKTIPIVAADIAAGDTVVEFADNDFLPGFLTTDGVNEGGYVFQLLYNQNSGKSFVYPENPVVGILKVVAGLHVPNVS